MLALGMGMRVAFVGNSHVLTLFNGYQLIHDQLPAGELTFIAKGRRKIGYGRAVDGSVEVGQAAGDVRDLVKALSVTHLFLMWRGSQVDVNGLLLTGPAFDVLLPSERDRVIDPDVDLIPCTSVESAVRDSLERDEELTGLIETARSTGARVLLMAPPPALPEDAVRARLGRESHFASRLAEICVSAAEVRVVPEPVRVRLRTLLYSAYRDFAEAHRAGFCPPPDDVADSRGMLLPPYWGDDITHGSAAYGAAYLQELVAVAGGRFD